MAGLWLKSHPNDPSKMVQTVFQPTRKKSAGVGSFWWKHLGGLIYDFLFICGCAILIAVFCRVGSVWVGSFLFQWKHRQRLPIKPQTTQVFYRNCFAAQNPPLRFEFFSPTFYLLNKGLGKQKITTPDISVQAYSTVLVYNFKLGAR